MAHISGKHIHYTVGKGENPMDFCTIGGEMKLSTKDIQWVMCFLTGQRDKLRERRNILTERVGRAQPVTERSLQSARFLGSPSARESLEYEKTSG